MQTQDVFQTNRNAVMTHTAYYNTLALRLNGHRDKPTVALADKWIVEAMELVTKE